MPTISPPGGLRHSPLLGAPPLQRDKLLFLRGDVGKWVSSCRCELLVVNPASRNPLVLILMT